MGLQVLLGFILAFAFLPCASGIPAVLLLSALGWREQGGTSGWGSGVLGQRSWPLAGCWAGCRWLWVCCLGC